MTDTTGGRIPVVGWMGLGSNALPVTVSSTNDLTKLRSPRFQQFVNIKQVMGQFILLEQGGVSSSGNYGELLVPENGSNGTKVAVRNKDTVFNLYNDKNKPTANDVGAYSKSESDARYVSDVQLGAGTKITTWNTSGNWPNKAWIRNNICFQDANDYNLDGVTYAPLQKKSAAHGIR